MHRDQIFWRGLSGRCPRCESADLFRSRYRLHPRCPHCQLPLELEDGWSYGSVPLSYGLACVFWVLPVALITLLDWIPTSAGITLGVIGVFILPVITFRLTKRMWVGLYYALLPNELRVRDEEEKGDDH